MKRKRITAIVFLATVLALIVVCCHKDESQLIANTELTPQETQLVKELRLRIESLEELTQANLTSLCDTMTVEQKLKQVELEKFSKKVHRENDSLKIAVYTEKDSLEMQSFLRKDKNEMTAFLIYEDVKYRALKVLEKSDPKNFRDYALICFWENNSSGSDYMDLFQKKKELEEKIISIKKFTEAEQTAHDLWQQKRDELDKTYQAEKKAYSDSCQVRKDRIDKRCQKLLTEKREALGL